MTEPFYDEISNKSIPSQLEQIFQAKHAVFRFNADAS